MREVLTLSFPVGTIKKIKSEAKRQGHPSVSSYMKYLLSFDEGLISNEELRKIIQQARQEHKAGKSIKAKSMAEFL